MHTKNIHFNLIEKKIFVTNEHCSRNSSDRMVAKKNVRTDYTRVDFSRIHLSKGTEGLEKIALALIGKVRKGNKNALTCLLSLLQYTHENRVVLLGQKDVEAIANGVLVEFEYTNAVKERFDLYMFSIGMLTIFPLEFTRVVHRMTDEAHVFATNIKRTRQMLAVIPQVAKAGLEIQRKTFLNLMIPVYKNLNELSSDDLCNLTEFLTATLVQVNQRSDSHGIQLHDLYRLKVVNIHLSNIYSELSNTRETNLLDKLENDKLRGTINRYFCAFMSSLPDCMDPLVEGERPLIDSVRRGLFEIALTQFEDGVANSTYKDPYGSRVVEEAVKLMVHFVFPYPAHFVFTDDRFLAAVRNASLSTNETTRMLAVRMSVSLVHTAWGQIHAAGPQTAAGSDTPLAWLRAEHPDLLFELSILLEGIVLAIPTTKAPYREKLIEAVSLYAMEDENGGLIGSLLEARADRLLDMLDGLELNKKEMLYMNVLADTLNDWKAEWQLSPGLTSSSEDSRTNSVE